MRKENKKPKNKKKKLKAKWDERTVLWTNWDWDEGEFIYIHIINEYVEQWVWFEMCFWRCIAFVTRKAGVTGNHLFVIFMCILVWFVLFLFFYIYFQLVYFVKIHAYQVPTNYMFLITFQARKTLYFFFILFSLFLFFCFYCGSIRRFYPSNYFLFSDRIYQGNQKINIICTQQFGWKCFDMYVFIVLIRCVLI